MLAASPGCSSVIVPRDHNARMKSTNYSLTVVQTATISSRNRYHNIKPCDIVDILSIEFFKSKHKTCLPSRLR